MKKRVMACLVMSTLILGACQSGQNKTNETKNTIEEGKQINVSQLAADVKSKYEVDDSQDFGEKIVLERDGRIKLDIGFNPKDKGMKAYTEIVEVFQDLDLTQAVGTHFDMDKETTYVEVLPPRSTIAGISKEKAERKDFGYALDDIFLFEKEANEDWGNLKNLYMVVKVDLATGQLLDKPIVSQITIKHEIPDDIRLKMNINDEGLAEFSWNEVPGAAYYYVVDIDYDPATGIKSNGWIRAKVEGTEWEAQPNDIRAAYKVSEADRQRKENIEKYGEGSEAIPNDSMYETRYAVVAVSEEGTSALSNTLELNSISKRIARHEEIGKSIETEGSSTALEIGLLPSYRWVTMNDGSLVPKLINYDISKAKETTELWAEYEKEDLSDLKANEVELITIPYTVEGTPFGGKARVENYYLDTWKDDLKKLEARQDELRNKAGVTEVEIVPEAQDELEETQKETKETEATKESSGKEKETTETTESTEKTKESSQAENEKGAKRRKKRLEEEAKNSGTQESSTKESKETKETTESSSETSKRRRKDTKDSQKETPSSSTETEKKPSSDETITEIEDKITANNPLSEYLAINMLDGKESIDLSQFPEARIQENLFDAWMEAIYQNPLILSAKGAQIENFGTRLKVTYEIERAEMKEKQAELRTEVKKVVSEIIKDDMSDLEKEYAINAYLIEIAEYDNDALDNAEKNNFVEVDAEFNDSFTPYGVLINKVGVCASYAGAFKLLADEAGLEAIVVTGYLEGNLPHAWNKVKIDGNWHILDTTNNDNDLLLNALLNIPAQASSRVLVEDELYVIDEYLEDYQASDVDKDLEYYHVEDKFYDKNKIADELITTIEKDGDATLRTSYDLTDDDFAEISEKVYNATKDQDLQGLYWMGVIYLMTNK